MPYALNKSTFVNIIVFVAFTSLGEISDPTSNSWHDISITVQSLLHLPEHFRGSKSSCCSNRKDSLMLYALQHNFHFSNTRFKGIYTNVSPKCLNLSKLNVV